MSKNKKSLKKKSVTVSANSAKSSSPVQPLGDRVVVVPMAPEEKTKSGILIPETVDREKPHQGKVIAVGPGKWNEDADARVPMSVRVGQTVIFSKYAPNEIKIDGKEYFIINESEILAVVE